MSPGRQGDHATPDGAVGFDLVIFDCDGVLVDSERLAIRTEAEILSRLGWPLTESDIIERFVGRSAPYMHGEIERHLGRSIDWEVEFESRYTEIFTRELVSVPFVIEALDHIGAATCVASSGSHERMEMTLGITGLLDRFRGRIFSADDVEHAKPAPDIFLHAARQMQVHPTRCAVIEDSISGVSAGLAAAMAVFGYAGVSRARRNWHCRARWSSTTCVISPGFFILPDRTTNTGYTSSRGNLGSRQRTHGGVGDHR